MKERKLWCSKRDDHRKPTHACLVGSMQLLTCLQPLNLAMRRAIIARPCFSYAEACWKNFLCFISLCPLSLCSLCNFIPLCYSSKLIYLRTSIILIGPVLFQMSYPWPAFFSHHPLIGQFIIEISSNNTFNYHISQSLLD